MPQDSLRAYAVACQVNRVRAARKARRMSQQGLSRRIGIDAANLRKYEKGRANVTLETLLKIAVALKADLVIEFADKSGLNPTLGTTSI